MKKLCARISILFILVSATYTLSRRDCPPGLRYNQAFTRCDYNDNVKC